MDANYIFGGKFIVSARLTVYVHEALISGVLINCEVLKNV